MVIVTHESYDSVLVGTEKNRKVLSRCLKTASDGADATRRGRSFQTAAPETGNARPSINKQNVHKSININLCGAHTRRRRLTITASLFASMVVKIKQTALHTTAISASFCVLLTCHDVMNCSLFRVFRRMLILALIMKVILIISVTSSPVNVKNFAVLDPSLNFSDHLGYH